MIRIPLSAFIAGLLILITGCTTGISSVQRNPGKFSMKDIIILGKINFTFDVPQSDYGIFLVSDSSGEAILLSAKQRKTGEQATIRGRVVIFSGNSGKELKEMEIYAVSAYLAEQEIVPENISLITARLLVETAREARPGTMLHFFVVEDTH